MPAPLNKYSSPHHAAQVAGRLAGHALRHRPDRRRHAQAPGRHRQRLVRRQHLQHAPERAGRAGQGGRAGGRPGRHAVQHHRRQRRHLDGHRGHELFAAVARPDRRLDRDGDARPVVRRQHRASRLRQEHARLPDGHGPPQPPVADGLRRHDQSRPFAHAGNGHKKARCSTSSRAFQCYGEYLAGRIDEATRRDIVRHACPGAGACGGMYTANTMASAIEALGMSLPYSASIPAEDPDKLDECFRAGAAIRILLERDLKPRDIMTRRAFENAMVVVMALGGSTNAVLHLIAMARAVDVPLTIDDFQSSQRPRAVSCRPQAQRPLRAGRPAQRRRHAGRDEVSARKGPARRRLPDRHRQDARREPRRACRA